MSAYVADKMGGKLTPLPFSSPNRAALKVKFGTCAGSETEALGMVPKSRRNGIPTVIVVDNATGEPLDEEVNGNAMLDIKNLAVAKCLAQWEESLE